MLHDKGAVKRRGCGKSATVAEVKTSNPPSGRACPANVFDTSRFPLVTFRLGNAYSAAEFGRILLDLTEIIKRGPFALITDMRQAQLPNATQRRAFIAMYENHDRLTRANFLVLGGVGDSILIRGVVTALNWLRPAPHPVQIFAEFDTAEAWVLDQLPPSLREQVPRAKGYRAEPNQERQD